MLRFRKAFFDPQQEKRVDAAIDAWHEGNPGQRIPYEEFNDFYGTKGAGFDQRQLAAAVHERASNARRKLARTNPDPSAAQHTLSRADLDKDPSLVSSIFDFEHPESGVGAETRDVNWSPGYGGTVRGVFTKDGKAMQGGEWERELHLPDSDEAGSAHHGTMILPPQVQDNGFSSAWLNHLTNKYRQHGIDQISLHANIDIGAYAWAKHGFVPDPDDHARMLKNFKRFASDQWGASKMSDADLDRASKVNHIKDIADFDTGDLHDVWTNDAIARKKPVQGHFGKAFLVNAYGSGHPDYSQYGNSNGEGGNGWHGTLNIASGNPDFARGEKYRANKLKSVAPAVSDNPEPVAKALSFGKPQPQPACPRCKRVHRGEGWHLHTGSDADIHRELLKDDGPLAPFRRISDSITRKIVL
jgi:GNAT superfamily N-acetyltransferase